MTFEQRQERGNERSTWAARWEETRRGRSPGSSKSKCKGPEAEPRRPARPAVNNGKGVEDEDRKGRVWGGGGRGPLWLAGRACCLPSERGVLGGTRYKPMVAR